MIEKRKKFGIELLPSLHQKMYMRAVGRGMKLYEAMQEAVERYLGEERRGPLDELPAKLRPLIAMVIEILESGDSVAIGGLEPVIRALHARLPVSAGRARARLQ